MGAVGDCELIRQGFLGQPANSVSTFAFVMAGVWLLRRGRARWLGLALMATGVGSFVFHGPMPGWGEWAHDVTLTWLIITIGGLQTRWERWSRWPSLLFLAVFLLWFPFLADPIAIALTVIVAGSILLRPPSRRELLPLGLVAAGAVFGRLGATGWVLCDPASIFQPHALWHLVAAIGVAWWASTASTSSTALSRP